MRAAAGRIRQHTTRARMRDWIKENTVAEIALSFPDGSQRNYPADITGAQLAESISK